MADEEISGLARLKALFDPLKQKVKGWATAPKLSWAARVERDERYEARRLDNAKKSGIGNRETARRARNVTAAKARQAERERQLAEIIVSEKARLKSSKASR